MCDPTPEIAAPTAEQALLGACLLDPSQAAHLITGLGDAWTTPATVAVAGIITDLVDTNRTPDPVTVLTELQRIWGPEIGGYDAGVLVGNLMDTCITPLAAPTWRDLLIEHSNRRRIASLAEHLVHIATTADTPNLTRTTTTTATQLIHHATQLQTTTHTQNNDLAAA